MIPAQPGIDTVTYETSEEAYAKYKALMADTGGVADPSVKPEHMPSSFRFTTPTWRPTGTSGTVRSQRTCIR
jgi:hypothetical protein